jgi:hypothetical protein
MKGFITTKVAALCLVGGLGPVSGCYCYRELVDQCWPERYTYVARQEVHGAIAPQVHNGHVLDQTIWNYHFEAGTERLTPGGLQHLAYLARRRPHPDPVVYLQTAQDITYDPAAHDKFPEARSTLDNRRIQAIQNYLTAQTSGRPVSFEVVLHDPAEVGMSAVPAGLSIQQMYAGARGALGLGVGAASAPTGGGGGAGGGGGGGGGGNGR